MSTDTMKTEHRSTEGAEMSNYAIDYANAFDRMFSNQRRSDLTEYESILSYADRCARAEAELSEKFLDLVRGGNLDAVATFEKPRLDHDKRTEEGTPTRPATLFDVLRETADYRNFDRELFALFVRAANGAHVSADARELMDKMAEKYASMNAEVE